ncbi:MAG: M20/M25/M40 family metallo-hydrolase [Clostridia bacterium]|nr:M20/M25/M40 family metallo-hydrolase [Clostridia bacterium]
MEFLTAIQEKWCEDRRGEAISLLKALAAIPAPSHYEDRRAAFVRDWLISNGAQGVYIDPAKNVLFPIGITENNPIAVIMAHTDVVFPDTENFEVTEKDGCLYAPGIGDDTANLTALLMAAKYVSENRLSSDTGVLIAANACEEGLGNLKGSLQIMNDFRGRVKEMISIDGGLTEVVNKAVGSVRMKITVHAEGGHSYGDFGNTNAIEQMAQIITRLYQKTPPNKAKTTYNVGVIEGGTTVNSIAGECSVLYEYRSENRECLREMDDFFQAVIEGFRAEGVNISVEVLGMRPCTGDVDENALCDLTNRMKRIMNRYTGNDVAEASGSTDANAALSQGVPGVTIGAIEGGGAHTRGEWIRTDSLLTGQKIALNAVLSYLA